MSTPIELPPFLIFPPSDIFDLSPYHYIPTFWVCVLFLSLFLLSTIIHTGQSLFYRQYWLLWTAVLCGVGESIGWSGRLWSSKDFENGTPFLIQISTTIISPTFLVAVNFIVLGRLIRLMGTQYSRFGPKTYTTIFVSCDVIALIIQAVGGGLASNASTPAGAQQGANIMLGGIVFQLVAIIVYSLLATEFVIRHAYDKPVRPVSGTSTPDSDATVVIRPLPRKLKLMVICLMVNTILLLIRSVYRTIELSNGWSGPIISTQILFNLLDGTPIALAMFILNALHPGYLLRVEAKPKHAPDSMKTTSI